jgi:MMPL family
MKPATGSGSRILRRNLALDGDAARISDYGAGAFRHSRPLALIAWPPAGGTTSRTAAGLVFAFTMASMVGSDMRAIGQFGSTVCVGLLLDTLIVRVLLMPSIATLLGRWFWWPQVVHTHAASQPPANSPARGPAAEATTQPLGPGAMNPEGQQ